MAVDAEDQYQKARRMCIPGKILAPARHRRIWWGVFFHAFLGVSYFIILLKKPWYSSRQKCDGCGVFIIPSYSMEPES
jgi:hypothetical protein